MVASNQRHLKTEERADGHDSDIYNHSEQISDQATQLSNQGTQLKKLQARICAMIFIGAERLFHMYC